MWLCQGNSSLNNYYLFPALKQNVDGHRFKGDRDVQQS